MGCSSILQFNYKEQDWILGPLNSPCASPKKRRKRIKDGDPGGRASSRSTAVTSQLARSRHTVHLRPGPQAAASGPGCCHRQGQVGRTLAQNRLLKLAVLRSRWQCPAPQLCPHTPWGECFLEGLRGESSSQTHGGRTKREWNENTHVLRLIRNAEISSVVGAQISVEWRKERLMATLRLLFQPRKPGVSLIIFSLYHMPCWLELQNVSRIQPPHHHTNGISHIASPWIPLVASYLVSLLPLLSLCNLSSFQWNSDHSRASMYSLPALPPQTLRPITVWPHYFSECSHHLPLQSWPSYASLAALPREGGVLAGLPDT